MNLPSDTLTWLLNSAPWVNYKTRLDILGERLNTRETDSHLTAILSDPQVNAVIADACEYFPKVATRHTDAKLSHYKIRMLVDFGLTKQHGLDTLLQRIKERRSGDLYSIRQLLPTKNADTNCEWNALPCDNPLLLYILLKAGDTDMQTLEQVELLKRHWETPSGWFCHLPFVESQFKKERVGCPMAGLMALEVFSLDENLKESKYAQNAFQALAQHFQIGKPIYYFGRGRKFHTFKYPFVWYNGLYLAHVLTRFTFARKHEMVVSLIDWVKKGGDEQGKYTPTSIFMNYKDWDFGNKRQPSPWLTYLCHKIVRQHEDK